MRRETRINLIFLTVFIVIALPGAVVLFIKKLDPTAHRLDQPDPILHRLPYMSPLPAPPQVKWVAPDRTQAWVESLTAPTPTLSAAPPGPEWEPVISADHVAQILVAARENSGVCLTVLLWSDPPGLRKNLFSASVDRATATVVRVKATPVPPQVRHELVMAGFVRPPKDVMLLEVSAPHVADSPVHRLEISCAGPATVRSEVAFKFPTAPAAAENYPRQ